MFFSEKKIQSNMYAWFFKNKKNLCWFLWVLVYVVTMVFIKILLLSVDFIWALSLLSYLQVDIWDERKVFGSRSKSLKDEMMGKEVPAVETNGTSSNLIKTVKKDSHTLRIVRINIKVNFEKHILSKNFIF